MLIFSVLFLVYLALMSVQAASLMSVKTCHQYITTVTKSASNRRQVASNGVKCRQVGVKWASRILTMYTKNSPPPDYPVETVKSPSKHPPCAATARCYRQMDLTAILTLIIKKSLASNRNSPVILCSTGREKMRMQGVPSGPPIRCSVISSYLHIFKCKRHAYSVA